MGDEVTEALASIVAEFQVEGKLTAVSPFPGGHINRSYTVTLESPAGPRRYVLQKINSEVFPRPDSVMKNIERVTTHLRKKLLQRGESDPDRRCLTLIPRHSSDPGDLHPSFGLFSDGGCWRLYRFLEGTQVRQRVTTPREAREAGHAFGEFLALLDDFPGPRLHEVLPSFHATPRRFRALDTAKSQASRERIAAAQREIDFAHRCREDAGILVDLLASGALPERVVHNDAKISNVLLDEASQRAICVVDLDTVMPGTALFDFGDMVRSMATRSAEDSPNPEDVEIELDLFEALVRGYFEACLPLLHPAERDHLLDAARVLCLEQGVRFLTDFLENDRYYRTVHRQQNLDRCRVAFKLVTSLAQQRKELQAVIQTLLTRFA